MSQQGWQAGLDAVDARIVDGYQSGFPIEERPFRTVGEAVDVSEREALQRVERLREAGVVRRFGAVLNPPVIGSSTLAALRVPEDRFEEVTEVVNSYRQVNHNYRRDHEWNMWFVVTAASLETRDRILADIERRTGLSVLNLPMCTDFYINLEFPVVNGDAFAHQSSATPKPSRNASGKRPREGIDGASTGTEAHPTRVSEEAVVDLTDLERHVVLEIQEGFPLSLTPFGDIAERVGAETEAVVAAIQDLLARNCIKRVGCIVNHVVTGFDANCMVVWDVPDDELDARAVEAGSLPYVTLCYHRPRRPDQDWPYNLFTMVHGREQEAVDAQIDELATEYLPVPHERLYSTETLKQTGARYEELMGE